MNKLKKIGLTALAGSLVTLGSHAGEMSVSGGINTTLKFGKGGGNTSRSHGADRDVTFSGGGELDNGTTFSMSTTLLDTTNCQHQQQQSQHRQWVLSQSVQVQVLHHIYMMKKFL
jgi:hypothetical protein